MCRTTTTSMSCSAKFSQTKTAKVAKKSRRKIKRRVSFNESDKVAFRHVLKEELVQAWYQPKEYKDFQVDRAQTIQTLRQAQGDLSVLNPREQCVRGLEMQATPEIYRFRSMGIRSTIRQVLNQQSLQQKYGLNDDGSLGMVSMLCSRPARNLASALAAIDSQHRSC